MHRIAHLSDLHLGAASPGQEAIFDSMLAALAAVSEETRPDGGTGVDLVVVTGDIFNDGGDAPERAVPRFLELFERVAASVGGARTILLPGNHDVRGTGVLGPDRRTLFERLREALGDDARVLLPEREPPFLAARLPRAAHGLPAEVVAIDSTYLARGFISAGGMLHQADLLRIAAELDGDDPVLVLLHHHLVPTPLTDLGFVATPYRWLLKLMTTAVANLDREELMMTATGAGSALTTLHTLGRPVLVLHGHKHYPAVRLIQGVYADHADILLSSAGSAGLAEGWSSASHPGTARLWPSFNVVDLDGGDVRIEAVSYPHEGHARKHVNRRAMLEARREGLAWAVDRQLDERTPPCRGPRLALDRAEVRLEHSPGRRHWSAAVTRTLRSAEPAPDSYVESFEAAPREVVRDIVAGGVTADALGPERRLALPLDAVSTYRLVDGFCATFEQAVRDYDASTSPYECVSLLNRYRSARAELVLSNLPASTPAPFGSLTDLTTGLERPAPLCEEGGAYVLGVDDCPPRTRLRIYWELPSA